MSKKHSVLEGFLSGNTVFSGLMVISPVIVCGCTVMNAAALIYVFSAITFFSVMIGSFVPKRLAYGVKIVIYAAIASVVYIPVKIAAVEFFPDIIPRTGIYFMLIAVNSLITVQTEAKFYRMKKGKMIISLILHILGFDIVMFLVASMRELLAYGTFCGRIVDADILISGLGQPFGGFILLGILCGIYRAVSSALQSDDEVIGGEGNVSDS